MNVKEVVKSQSKMRGLPLGCTTQSLLAKYYLNPVFYDFLWFLNKTTQH
jgi:hypothetical protein